MSSGSWRHHAPASEPQDELADQRIFQKLGEHRDGLPLVGADHMRVDVRLDGSRACSWPVRIAGAGHTVPLAAYEREAAHMNPVFTSLVAVVGTLAGSTLTFLFQRHIARQGEVFARSQQLWHEKTAAYTALAASLTDFRRSQNDRWHLERRIPPMPMSSGHAKSPTSGGPTLPRPCAGCVLSVVDSALSQLAQDALDAATDVHLAGSEQDRAERGQTARLALDSFLAQAASQIL